jgi:integrase
MASIRKRRLKSGEIAWQVDYRDQGGKRRHKQFGTRREADSWMVQARAQVAAGTHVADSASATVRAAAEIWLNHLEQRRINGLQMERASIAAYRSYLDNHVLVLEMALAALKLTRITRSTVNQYRDRLLANGRSVAMARKALKALRLLLAHALDNEMIGTNPAQGVRVHAAGRVKAKITIPGKPIVKAMIEQSPDDFRALVMVAALCGLRSSEIRGLRWRDVDFAESYIRVSQRADRYCEIGETKSEAGTRSVPIGPTVTTELKKWKLRCPRSELDLVFPTGNGTVQNLENMRKLRYRPLCDRIGTRARFHDLRHFAVSLWIEQGFPPKAIMEFAGHASITLTMDLYGHLFPSADHHAGMAEVERRLLG